MNIENLMKINKNNQMTKEEFSTKLMIKELHELNSNNVYIDMGSILNTKLYNDRRRNIAKKRL